MTVLPIHVIPDPVLNRKAREITDIDDRICNLARNMAETMYHAPGIGLAANQVGELCRLIVVDVVYAYAEPALKTKQPVVLINPRICAAEGETVFEEGCLSVPDFGVDVARHEQIQVHAVDLNGDPIVIEADGLLARALQHEIDHLDGVTILEHASTLKRSIYQRKMKKKARSKS
jgi:peptide deformylase